MSASVCVPWDEALIGYDFGHDHPLNPLRVELTMRLARDLGVLDLPTVSVVRPAPATDAELLLVHEPEYVEAVKVAGADPSHEDLARGLGTADTPTFLGMHEASALIVGATLAAARAVWTGATEHGVNIAGGLHHAMPGAGSGFCVYNDPAVAIAWMLEQGAERVAYVDVDVHHGDGVERAFWDDDRVLTISVHESGRYLFPGTGFPEDTGGLAAQGLAVNLALPPGTADGPWLRAFHAVVPQLLREFSPEVLVTQHGCDSHMDDPLTNLMLSVDGQRASYLALRDLAEEVCGGKWVATGGGGYAVMDVVPRAWAHLLAIVAGSPLDPSTLTPDRWRARIEELRGSPGPLRMTDGRAVGYRAWEQGYDPASWLDRSIQATRTAAFPLNGLDPQP